MATTDSAGSAALTSFGVDVPSGQVTGQEVDCEPGLVPLSGGVQIFSGQVVVNVRSSYPTARGWVGEIDNSFGSDVLFDVEVVCAKQPRRYAIVQTPAEPNPSGAQSTAFAQCPGRLQPVGGGARTNTTERARDLNSSLPVGNSWRVDENNATSTDSTFSVFAVCARLKGYQVVHSLGATVPANGQVRVTATCPAPTVPVGGGVSSSTSDIQNNIGATVAVGNGWDSIENNVAPFSTVAGPYAVCAGT